jgi:serine/threonine-protein kinase
MVLAHVQTLPLPPSQRTEMEVPGSLERVILQCLEKDPARRPETARKLAELLAACDGVGTWTQKEAERWWSSHLPEKGIPLAAAAGGAGDQTW